MNKDFYVFRHGQTDKNLKKIWQGSKIDSELNSTGKTQAAELKERLLPLNIEVVYSSPLTRATQTAILAQYAGFPIYIRCDLRECNFGDAEGRNFDEVQKLYPEVTHAMFNPTPDKWHMKFPGKGSESKKEVFERVKATLMDIAHRSSCKSIGISTHAAVMSSLLAGLRHSHVPVENCCVAHIKYDETTDTLIFMKML